MRCRCFDKYLLLAAAEKDDDDEEETAVSGNNIFRSELDMLVLTTYFLFVSVSG